MKRGQFWSYDAMVSIIIFVLALSMIVFFWWSMMMSMARNEVDIIAQTEKVADVLLSPGNPDDWDALINSTDSSTWSPVVQVGLLEDFDSKELSQSKLESFMKMADSDYPTLKAKLRANYDFIIQLKEFYNCSDPAIQNSPINCTGRGIPVGSEEWNSMEHFVAIDGRNFSVGQDPDVNNARSISVSKRFAIYNKSIVMLKVILWTNQTWR